MTNLYDRTLLTILLIVCVSGMSGADPVALPPRAPVYDPTYDMTPTIIRTELPAKEATIDSTNDLDYRIELEVAVPIDQPETEPLPAVDYAVCIDACEVPPAETAEVVAPSNRQQSTSSKSTGYWRTGLLGRRRWVSTGTTTTTNRYTRGHSGSSMPYSWGNR